MRIPVPDRAFFRRRGKINNILSALLQSSAACPTSPAARKPFISFGLESVFYRSKRHYIKLARFCSSLQNIFSAKCRPLVVDRGKSGHFGRARGANTHTGQER